MYEQQPSPATSTGTVRTNRGGRPKEWTDPRTRRLTRLYCYTTLKVDEILKVLEDEIWSPGKEAANKHLNNLLGKDPRWVRPKDITEARQRMAGLKNSERATKRSQCDMSAQASPQSTGAPHDAPHFGIPRSDTMDGTTLGRSSGSSYEKRDAFMFANGQDPAYGAPPNAVHPDVDFRNQYHPTHPSLSRFIPKIRSRQGTALTTSTNFSVGSTREAYLSMQQKLKQVNNNLVRSDIKDVFRLLKRFTISNEGENDSRSCSPSDSARPHRGPSHADLLARYQEEGVTPADVARYPLPGEFIGTSHSLLDPVCGTDLFGNTCCHMLATTEGGENQLIQFVSDIARKGSLLNARNTGNETFLHVLHDMWFEKESRLTELVDKLRGAEFDFYAKDVYGRTFFHLLRQKYDLGKMREITRQFDMARLNSRDAFGVRPMIARASTMSSRDGPARLTIPTTDTRQERINHNTQLLKIITGVNDTPQGWAAEDSQGRNALHCLAEVVLGLSAIEAHANGTRAPKRKMDDKDQPEIQVVNLSKRIQYLDTVLESHVNVNHYNANGDTVLMAFVTHIVDGHDDKDLELLLKRLIAAGAELEARNRDGETVLQVAARLGQKFAVRVLVEHGANLHVRNCQGRSVLQMIDGLTKMSQDWPEQIARLEATRAVLTGRWSKFQAVQDPDWLQEWGIRTTVSPSP